MSALGQLGRVRGLARDAINRLRIRGKLNLLLALPLAAILIVAVPFVTTQIDNAGAAARTATVSGQARLIGRLVSELQREQLVMAAYLGGVTDRDVVNGQTKAVKDLTKQTRADLGRDITVEEDQALVRLDSLDNLRESVLAKAATPESLARTYQATEDALIDSLRLVPQVGADTDGARQLTSLEALFQADEQSALSGVGLLIAAGDKNTGIPLLNNAVTQARISTDQFVQQADANQAGVVVAVEQGDEARAVQTLVERAPDPRDKDEAASFAASAYNSVGAQSTLRANAQDKVTSLITSAAENRASAAATNTWLVGVGLAALIALVAAVAAAVSRSIAGPMKQLTKAASEVATLADTELTRVADTEVPANEQVPRLAAIEVSTQDEMGELAQAFNRVQATAASLVERQALTRRNVSLMFANVAQRTQNLVGRQLTLVDELERNEQDSRLLSSLYKLDHLSTRLRRSADNLLVVAGTRSDTKLSGPMDLGTSLRSALAEIEDYQRVQLGEVCDITLDGQIGSDMVLVFAELLENATAYSPPEAAVEVSSRYLMDGSCLVTIIDHGIGMTQERLAEENRRLVARERLDITPTSMLGLFVVGRLARRHHLTVAMVGTDGGGVTVDVVVPEDRFHRNDEPETAPQPVISAAALAGHPENGQVDGEWVLPTISIPPAFSENFNWFPPEASEPVVEVEAYATGTSLTPVEPMASSPPDTTVAERGGLRRRHPGAQMPGLAQPPARLDEPVSVGRHAERDAAQDRGEFEGYESALVRASVEQPVPTPTEQTAADGTRAGLIRRVPGENMAPGLRVAKPGRPPARVSTRWRQRDPAADRSNLDDFTTGLSRASSAPIPRENDG
jgi:signal transduction histidine kinase